MSTETPATELVSGKWRKGAYDKANQIASRHEVTKMDVFDAAIDRFDRLPRHVQRKELDRVLELNPRHSRRMGRGNRKSVDRAA